MTITEELAVFSDRFPDCFVVAFADLSTGMVLASHTTEKTTQEKLDALCVLGSACLSGAGATSGLLDKNDGSALVAWHADEKAVYCFVKAPQPAAEALCLTVGPDVDLNRICSEAKFLLSALAREG